MHFHVSNCPKNTAIIQWQLCTIPCFSTFSPQKQTRLIPDAQKKTAFPAKKVSKSFLKIFISSKPHFIKTRISLDFSPKKHYNIICTF